MIRKGIAVGIILLLFVGTSISVAYDTSTDEVREPPHSAEIYFIKYAFAWGTYEHRWKDWVGGFEIWNDDFSKTIHVIGYGPNGSNDTYIWMHIEACQVKAQRHLGIIGPHQCCIFAFGWLGVTVDGVRQ